ncbi:hypothetical protein [Magnetospirillum sp. UT-4]|uniref:hypothetical protein n=1 Tax=Magnetospirillum sp. UT-4 TaxID=2681467 RepID=UPI001384FCA0|nr:hypothetical protein [Magnetospirillum sp. UT-4]CAA7620674.1 conserved membrane hypothetical protein [Magnetospirillum sp. UT-4]
MGFDEINFLALPVAFLLALVGTPVVLLKAGYPKGKTAFGTLALTAVALALFAIVLKVQTRADLTALPLAWLAPVAIAVALWQLKKMA